MIKLLKDSRDLFYSKHYGQTPFFPTELNVDTGTADTIQPAGSVLCTAITVCDIACDQVGTEYSYMELFSRVPSTNEGAEPRKVLSEAVKNGLTPLELAKQGIVEKKWKSYFRADEGDLDFFDNIRSALYLAQSPVALCTPWYWGWVSRHVLTLEENVTNYHMYSAEGWAVVDGEPMLIIEAWIGKKQYMPRAVCNKMFSSWGSQAWVLATDEIDGKRTKTIMQKIIDALTNVIILIREQITLKQPMETDVKETVSPFPASQKIYDISKSLLKKHLTLDESVPKNVGCAQALSYVLKQCGYPIPKGGISGTYTLWQWLKVHFTEVEAGKPGDIIINATGTGLSTRRGHVGVVGKYQIMSNNSITGLWDTAWELRDWLRFYEEQGKMKTRYFRAK